MKLTKLIIHNFFKNMQITDQRKKNRNSLDNNYKQLTSSDEETTEEDFNEEYITQPIQQYLTISLGNDIF